MSDEWEKTQMIRRVRLAFGFLVCVGLFTMAWGFVGNSAAGAAFSEVVVDEFHLPKEPETYGKIARLYARNGGFLSSLVALLILFPSLIGLWATASKTHDPRP
jgi:hypothetical protein